MTGVCKLCRATDHTAFHCRLKRNKPIKRSTTPLKRTRLKKIGPVTRKWIETRKLWIEMHPGPWHCFYCGCALDLKTMQLDHRLSRSRHPELRYELSNLVASCHFDNEAKGSLSLDEYIVKRRAPESDAA